MATPYTHTLATEQGEGGGSALVAIWIEATEGPGVGARLRLEAGTVTVGASSRCDLKVEDPAVSREHLCLELMAGTVLVRDLKSRNGTYYLGARIEQARVPVGGSIRIGRTQLRFRPDEEALPTSEQSELAGLVGESTAMRRLFGQLERIGRSETTALLLGETGVGKSSIARALHSLSARNTGPFVTFDCGAVTPTLIESELFGHARGAFTGADRARVGAVEQANRGTLFLDELAELPLGLQPKLLRLLEEREISRVGETERRRVDIRVIAATSQDLEKRVEEGRFRSDLYYRVAVINVPVPPLRERPEDVAALAKKFAEAEQPGAKLPPSVIAAFQSYKWPGNVRELRNAVQRYLTLGTAAPLGIGVEEAAAAKEAANVRAEALARFERDFLAALLERHEGNVSSAAREANVSRRQMYRLLERHKLGHYEGKD